MATTTIKAVIFDVANVIADWSPRRPLEGLPADQVDAFLGSEGFWAINAEADAGLGVEEMRARVAAELPELSDTFDAYLENFPRSVSGPVAGTSEIIDELRDRGVPVYGLSNWWKGNFTVARQGAPVIDRLDDVVVSGEVGLAKPGEEIFLLALQRFGLDAATTLFVDDTLVNVQTADRLGFTTHHFTDAAGLRATLTELGLL